MLDSLNGRRAGTLWIGSGCREAHGAAAVHGMRPLQWKEVIFCVKRRKRDIRRMNMKRELGIARCGLACCLCSENRNCAGCNSGQCPDKGWCENRKCSLLRGLAHCYDCDEDCKKGLLSKIKPYAFSRFAKEHGEEYLLNCLARNEENGIVYHREGIVGDYDLFDDVEKLMDFIQTGRR
jgi:hypothetical protein